MPDDRAAAAGRRGRRAVLPFPSAARNVTCGAALREALHGGTGTKGTALYRALVEAGASEERAKEAAESVVHAPEGATKADIVGVNANIAGVRTEVAGVRTEVKTDIAGVRTEIAEMELRIERSLRQMSWRFTTLLVASQAVLLAGLRLTGG